MYEERFFVVSGDSIENHEEIPHCRILMDNATYEDSSILRVFALLLSMRLDEYYYHPDPLPDYKVPYSSDIRVMKAIRQRLSACITCAMIETFDVNKVEDRELFDRVIGDLRRIIVRELDNDDNNKKQI